MWGQNRTFFIIALDYFFFIFLPKNLHISKIISNFAAQNAKHIKR